MRESRTNVIFRRHLNAVVRARIGSKIGRLKLNHLRIEAGAYPPPQLQFDRDILKVFGRDIVYRTSKRSGLAVHERVINKHFDSRRLAFDFGFSRSGNLPLMS